MAFYPYNLMPRHCTENPVLIIKTDASTKSLNNYMYSHLLRRHSVTLRCLARTFEA